MPVVPRFLLMAVSCGKDNKIRCLFDEESSGNCVAFSVYCRQGMFAGSRLQGNFVEILCLCLIGVVEMPEDSGIGIAVCQFHRDKAFAAIQLLGQLDVGVHRRVDEQRVGKDFDFTATGHYATTLQRNGKTWLGTAKDPVKDQTDFLAQIDYLQVSKLMFPIGGLMKQEVREIANKAGLPSARRKDSQGICFLGKINYNDFVRRFLGEKEGAIIELETEKKLGTHRGYWFHTIGQRKGLGLSGGPWFVVKKDMEENTIYVSRGYGVETQYGNEFRMHDFHFITDNPWKGQEKEIDITFKIRHTPDFTKGKLIQEGEKQFHILSSEKLQGIAPGQFGVIYDEEAKVCVGSGEIIC